MLILFDIDGTLLRTEGAGMAALSEAAGELFGPHVNCDGIPAAGRLDPLIFADMLVRAGIEPSITTMGRLRTAYRQRLEARLAQPGHTTRAMPGVQEILVALRPHVHASSATLGLLTGNFAETGRLKLLACGIDPDQFTLNVWGDESPSTPPTRNDLPGVGLRRYHERHGRVLPGDRAVIIGDTPHDVACAKAHGCRSIGVATGKFSTAELSASGADLALETLEDTPRLVAWLVQ